MSLCKLGETHVNCIKSVSPFFKIIHLKKKRKETLYSFVYSRNHVFFFTIFLYLSLVGLKYFPMGKLC